MKKLSELTDDTMLALDCSEIEIMSKEDYLDSSYFLDGYEGENPKLFIAEMYFAKFDLYGVLENMQDDMYEDWLENIWDGIYDLPEVKDFTIFMDKILKSYPSYTEGEIVDIDMKMEEDDV